jgi:hypothetical protein
LLKDILPQFPTVFRDFVVIGLAPFWIFTGIELFKWLLGKLGILNILSVRRNYAKLNYKKHTLSQRKCRIKELSGKKIQIQVISAKSCLVLANRTSADSIFKNTHIQKTHGTYCRLDWSWQNLPRNR